MKVLIRKAITGTEYWCTKAKRTLFVPKGKEPNFDVTDNAKSMLKEPVVTVKDTPEPIRTVDPKLGDMNTGQLIVYAEKNGIDVPGTMKKPETIRRHIENALDESK